MAQSGSYDFNLTRNQIVADALDMVGNASPDNTARSKANIKLNMMVKFWQAEGINLWSTQWITQTLTASDVVVGTDGNDYQCIRNHTSAASNKPVTGADYTTYWLATGGTGSGSVWVTATAYTAIGQYSLAANVIGIDKAFIRRDETDNEVDWITKREYFELGSKYTEGLPTQYWFDRQFTPQIYLYPFPDETTDVLHLSVFRKTQDFDGPTDNPDFSEEWLLALSWGLAAQLAPAYGLDINERRDLRQEAERIRSVARHGTDESMEEVEFIVGR